MTAEGAGMVTILDMTASSAMERLLAGARDPGDPDRRALACVLAHRCGCSDAPYRRALGLDPQEARALVRRYFPAAARDWTEGECWRRHARGDGGHCRDGEVEAPAGHGRFSARLLEQEEQDLCRLFLNHASGTGLWPVVFARLIARACMEPEHLWMSLGLENRGQLTGILERHFTALAAKNDRDMRWKKFFYKLLCDVEKVWTCTASSCEICPHHGECFAPEL